MQYAAKPSLTSPRLCPTGVNVYALSFRYVWGDMTGVPQPFNLSVSMDTDTESTLLWSTNNGSADSSNITISCPDCSFRVSQLCRPLSVCFVYLSVLFVCLFGCQSICACLSLHLCVSDVGSSPAKEIVIIRDLSFN